MSSMCFNNKVDITIGVHKMRTVTIWPIYWKNRHKEWIVEKIIYQNQLRKKWKAGVVLKSMSLQRKD